MLRELPEPPELLARLVLLALLVQLARPVLLVPLALPALPERLALSVRRGLLVL